MSLVKKCDVFLALSLLFSGLVRLVRVRLVTLLLSSQGVAVSRSLLPTSLFEHLSRGQVVHPPTQRGPHSTRSVLSRSLRPCSHRMCVTAKRLGSLPLARTCSKTWVPHLGTHLVFIFVYLFFDALAGASHLDRRNSVSPVELKRRVRCKTVLTVGFSVDLE